MSAMKPNVAIRAAFLCFLGLGSQFSEAAAQESIPRTSDSGGYVTAIGRPSLVTAAPSVEQWQQIKNEASASEVTNILENAGWEAGIAAAELGTLSQEETFAIYSRNIGAGISDFLVVPKTSDQLHPLEFRSAASSGIAQAVFLPGIGRMPTAKEIQDEIIAGMQAALNSFCAMDARPSEIKAKASAAGFVEVEATWMTAEVCDKRD